MKDLIYNQNKIPKSQWRYGFRSSAATGCGWIAAYNALRLMGYYVTPEKLIRSFQRGLPLINGNFGTFLFEPMRFFKKQGFPLRVTARRGRFDELARESDANVLFYYWRRKFRLGAHFVALEYQDGNFVGYNTYRSSDGPDNYGSSLESFLRRQKYFFPVLIAIWDKKKDKETGTF